MFTPCKGHIVNACHDKVKILIYLLYYLFVCCCVLFVYFFCCCIFIVCLFVVSFSLFCCLFLACLRKLLLHADDVIILQSPNGIGKFFELGLSLQCCPQQKSVVRIPFVNRSDHDNYYCLYCCREHFIQCQYQHHCHQQ